jgi:outer membrane protein assembly factor BamA
MLAPGIGIRFLSPLGPVRFDLGYDPTRTVVYPLLASRPDGTFLNIGEALYDPYGGRGGGGLTRLRRRLQLQFSLGQPF